MCSIISGMISHVDCNAVARESSPACSFTVPALVAASTKQFWQSSGAVAMRIFPFWAQQACASDFMLAPLSSTLLCSLGHADDSGAAASASGATKKSAKMFFRAMRTRLIINQGEISGK